MTQCVLSRPRLGALALCAGLGGLALAAPAAAGPPFATDDPQPTDQAHWEIYGFVNAAHVPGESAGEGGLDLNYGGAKDLQLTLVLPFAYDRVDGATHTGFGVVEAAAKYKLVHQSKTSWVPDVAVFPRLFLPTAAARFASKRVNLLLPVWAQKDYGRWSVFGGGGYQLNPGAGNRNFLTGGLTVTRVMTERLLLGAEVSHRSRDSLQSRSLTGVNIGAVYKVTPHWAVMAAGGPGVQHAREEGQWSFYLATLATY